MRHPPDRRSLWEATAPSADAHRPLGGPAERDVVVVGGGMTGLTTALVLVESGLDVMVLEARGLAAGTTGGTTGKLTSQHGLIYADLVKRHGEEAARSYGLANQAAIGQLRDLGERHGIDAAFEPQDAWLCADVAEHLDDLRAEFEAARDLGLPAEWHDASPMPMPAVGAVRFHDQAQFHAVRWCQGAARAIERLGGAIHTGTRVVSVDEADGAFTVQTEHGAVRARHVVIATLIPITGRAMEFNRGRPMTSHAIAARVDEPVAPGMVWTTEGWSVRTHREDGAQWLLVVGQSHETGTARGGGSADEAIEAYARQHFPVGEVTHRWSAQDLVADDRLPLVGRTAWSERLYVATGFQKWGLTNAVVASGLLTSLVQERDHPLADLLAPTRLTLSASARRFVGHTFDVARHFIGDRLDPEHTAIEDIPRGQGAVLRVEGRMTAVHRDDAGAVTMRSAVCPHLGCIVRWNEPESSWDCPCHGSRFDLSGEVLDGPATTPLAKG